MSEAAVRALIARWEQDVANLYAANEEERHAVAATARAARAEEIERCTRELRDALSASHGPALGSSAVSAGVEASGGAGEAQEG